MGPWEGCLRQPKELSLKWADRAWTRPMVTVLLPSPSGVGVMLQQEWNALNFTFDLYDVKLYTQLLAKQLLHISWDMLFRWSHVKANSNFPFIIQQNCTHTLFYSHYNWAYTYRNIPHMHTIKHNGNSEQWQQQEETLFCLLTLNKMWKV